MTEVLITGIAGQTGSHLADYILENHPDATVHGTVRYRSDLSNLSHIKSDRLKLHDCELRDAHNVSKVIKKIKPDKVFHLAATSFVRSSWDQPADVMVNNTVSQVNLFEALVAQIIQEGKEVSVQIACFPEETRVQTPFGYSKIKDIKVGDYLTSHNGEFNIISNKSCVFYDGKMTNLHIAGCKKFKTTLNHPILAFKRNNITYPSGKRRPRTQWPQPQWIAAGELNDGDYIAIVQPTNLESQCELDLNNIISKGVTSKGRIYPPCYVNGRTIPNGNSRGLPSIIKLNYKFGYLCGAYLAEGSQSGRNKAIRLHIHQDELIEGIGINCINILNEQLGLTAHHYSDGDSKGATVFIGSSILAELFKKLFGSGSKTKVIDDQIFSWNRECIIGLLKGYLDGDGTLSKRRYSETLIGSSVSEQLIDQLFILGNNVGLNPSRGGPYRAGENSFGNSISWEIKFSQNWASDLFDKKISPIQCHEIIYNHQYFRRILSTNITQFRGEVYNFTVENAHTYVVEGCCVHNCSSEQYGKVLPEEIPITENNDLRPISPYAVSKCTQEALAYQYWQSYGLPTIMTRTFNHTGSRRPDVFVESSFCKQVAMIEAGLQDPVIKHGNLESIRDYTDARDVAKAYWLAMGKCNFGEPYNICSNMRISIGELLDLLISLSNYNGTIEKRVDPDRLRPSDVTLLYGDSSKFNKITGWSPEYKLEQTMADLLAAWRQKIEVIKLVRST